MINKNNVRDVILHNLKIREEIKTKIKQVHLKGTHFMVNPLSSIQNYLLKNTELLLTPSKAQSYGGMVFYRKPKYYVHINTLQPKTYENFVWAHEFYHYEFEKERIQNEDELTFVYNSALNESERCANMFAAEILIDDDSLFTFFRDTVEQNPDDDLEINVIRLIQYFKLPYKSLVIKLAQDNLISIEDAETIIDFDYRKHLPIDFDLTILEPTASIKVDNLETLIRRSELTGVMSDSEIEAVKSTFNKHIVELEKMRHNTRRNN